MKLRKTALKVSGTLVIPQNFTVVWMLYSICAQYIVIGMLIHGILQHAVVAYMY